VSWDLTALRFNAFTKTKAARCAYSQNHRNSVGEPTVLTAATYLDELNPEQRRAVEHGVRQDCTVGPPILAGAGSGKTMERSATSMMGQFRAKKFLIGTLSPFDRSLRGNDVKCVTIERQRNITASELASDFGA
jgi:hypothetical protein